MGCLSVLNEQPLHLLCNAGKFVEQARNKYPLENTKLKLTTKSLIETRQPEIKFSSGNSRSSIAIQHQISAAIVVCLKPDDDGSSVAAVGLRKLF